MKFNMVLYVIESVNVCQKGGPWKESNLLVNVKKERYSYWMESKL